MTTTHPFSRVLDCTSAEELNGFCRAVRDQVTSEGLGWYVQMDLHGNDLDGPFETEDEALSRAEEAERDGETSGSF